MNVDGTWRHNANGWRYQYANGKHATNTWVKDGGKWYYFNERGLMVTGWKQIDNHWYYFQPSGQNDNRVEENFWQMVLFRK